MIPFELANVVVDAAYAAMLLFSCLLYRRIRHRHFSIQALGFTMLISAQAIIFIAYQVYTQEFDSGGGMLDSEPRNTAMMVSVWLSIFGFFLASVGYALQYLGVGRHAEGTQLFNEADR